MSANAPIAPTFTIAFEGLMLFHGGGAATKSDVAIVDSADGDHKAKLKYHDANGNEQIVDLLRGDIVSFSLPPGPADTDRKFDKYVVSLDEYTRWGGLDDEVLRPSASHEGVFARVELPGGGLTTYRTFKERVRLRKWITPDERCFPRWILLETPFPNDVTVRIEGTRPTQHTVPRGGYVIVSNGCVTKGSHFHEYGRLLSTFGWLASATLLEESCQDRDADTTTPLANRNVIKLLDKLYPNIPNGDCGPIKP